MRTVPVSKCLDKKLVIFGYEVPDILAIFLTLSILNFLFGQTPLQVPLVWMPTIFVAVVLRVGKKGKPEKHLIHWIRYQFQPGIFSAFNEPTKDKPFKKGVM